MSTLELTLILIVACFTLACVYQWARSQRTPDYPTRPTRPPNITHIVLEPDEPEPEPEPNHGLPYIAPALPAPPVQPLRRVPIRSAVYTQPQSWVNVFPFGSETIEESRPPTVELSRMIDNILDPQPLFAEAYTQPQSWAMFPVECLEIIEVDALPTASATPTTTPHYTAAEKTYARYAFPRGDSTPMHAEPFLTAFREAQDSYYRAQAITPLPESPLQGKIRRVPAPHRVTPTPTPERALEMDSEGNEGAVNDGLDSAQSPYAVCQVCEYVYRADNDLYPVCPMCTSEYDFRDVARLQRELDESAAIERIDIDQNLADARAYFADVRATPPDNSITDTLAGLYSIAIAPAQLDMTQEVQLQAAMPVQADVAPELPTVEPDIEGVPAHLIHAACNDRTVFDLVELRELAESIDKNGLHQAITVRPCADGTYEIVMGERRYRAMTQILGWATIPQNYVNIREMTDIEASRAMFEENLKRVDLNPIDEANAYAKRMRDFGLSESDIAKELGFSLDRIKSRLALLGLSPDVQLLVQGGSLPLGAADCMTGLDSNFQVNALRYYQSKNPTVSEFRAFCSDQLLDQNSLAFLDFDEFMTEAGAEKELARIARLARQYPTNDRMPAMPKASSVSLAIETYIADLLQSNDLDLIDAAAIVGSVYQGLLDTGLTRRPKRSPLMSMDMGESITVINTPVARELVAA
jgi:ParB/RepB/Spo0J family partition protein